MLALTTQLSASAVLQRWGHQDHFNYCGESYLSVTNDRGQGSVLPIARPEATLPIITEGTCS